MAGKFTDSPIEIVGSGQASDSLSLHHRKDICTMGATRAATQRAFKMAGLSQKDVDVAEVHDNFTISEIIAIEDLGFFPKGEGGKATEEGLTSLDGDVAVNTSGGLKARGDPIGATGVAQAVEIVSQLRGKADKRQVKDADVGLTQNVGGTGATVVVHLFRRV
jgi:acetyl-CoA C-acetyltransferase